MPIDLPKYANFSSFIQILMFHESKSCEIYTQNKEK
jgi:hypothetical protein